MTTGYNNVGGALWTMTIKTFQSILNKLRLQTNHVCLVFYPQHF